jgi:putative transcriptional regulator
MKSCLSQADFANLLGVSVRTLLDWERGRRQPSGAARTLITIAEQQPKVLKQVFKDLAEAA